ncbi:hypothetical protein [Undibacterium luofuense]|uniref:hypothetical protein n=1 Tax=Undibacterium luofuense TaxID=2828733 RepID=UPI0030EC0367
MQISEITATTTGNADLLRKLRRMVDQRNPPPARRCGSSTHHSRSASSDNDNVKMFHPATPAKNQARILAKSLSAAQRNQAFAQIRKKCCTAINYS